jgi:predicted HTH transcriptional regulator
VARPYGEPVLIVNVPRGSDRPYSTHDNVVWVRKGATNRRPDPRTELPGLYPRARSAFGTGYEEA